jgi:hypothetical protein
MEFFKIYLDDLLIVANTRFDDNLLDLEMFLTILSIVGMRVNAYKSNYLQNRLITWPIGSPDKLSSRYTTKWKPS